MPTRRLILSAIWKPCRRPAGMYMGNASIIPRNYRKYLYHAYLAYMEANGYRNVLSLKMFGLGLPVMLKEFRG